MGSKREAVEILVVDDNIGDARLLEEMFAGSKNPNHVHIARSGREALNFMRREGHYHAAPLPNLILLDINMPEMSGIEVLKEIRQDPDLSNIPVIILSSSDDEGDVCRCYDLHANSYLTKPMGLDELDRMVSSIDSFWLSAVRFPSTGSFRRPTPDYH